MKFAPLNIPELLKKYDLRPSKGLGQNFLVDESALQKIVRSAEIAASDTVLEIGPGLGSLTRHLALAAQRVLAVELDEGMLAAMQEVLAPYENVRVLQGDILETDMPALIGAEPYLVVANIPYYITSAVIRHLLDGAARPKRIVLTVQKEVAQRICAGPGDHSLLSLSVQVYGDPRLTHTIPAGAFYPAPKVDSGVVRIDLYPEPLVSHERLDDFFALIKAGFSQKRKTLRNTLSAGLHLEKDVAETLLNDAQIDPQRRAQTLSIDEWIDLVNALQTSRRNG